MKSRTIEKILRGQFANYLKSIKDKNVQILVKENTIITGGAIVSLLLNEKVNDFDLYFTNKETVLAIIKYYQKLIEKDLNFKALKIEEKEERIKIKIQGTGIIRTKTENKKFYPIIITDNAISLSNNIQLIIRFYGPPEEIHKNYDYEHVKSYWLSKDGKLYINSNSIEAILTKELRYTGSLYPLASLFRLRKFLTRGWTITAGDIFKIAFQVSKLNFDDPEVMYDQLIGVDTLYFTEMIERIKSDLKEKKIKRVTQDYLSDLVEEIFHQSSEYIINE